MASQENQEVVEENFNDPVEKFDTFGNLENTKRAFFNKEYEVFETELKKIPCKFYYATFRDSSEMDGRPDFVAKNFTTGLVKELDDFRKYFLTVFRCFKNDNGTYTYESLWIVNTSDVKKLYKDRYDDFTWKDADDNFLNLFRPCEADNLVNEKYLH